jgi:hypothetical protein
MFSTTRRGFLRGSLSAALALAGVRRASGALVPPARHVIFIYLAGGPSHIDTFDPKPGTKAGGPFRAIPTSISGVSFTEHLPLLAERARDLVVLRGLTTKEGSHERARAVLHSGFSPIPGTGFPAFGATLSRERGARDATLPGYVCLGGTGESAGLHGPAYEPFVVLDARSGKIPHIAPPPGVDRARLERRLALQRLFTASSGVDVARDYQAAVDRTARLMSSPHLTAFAASGATRFEQHCVVARQLVEAGVTCVEVELDGWDGHKDNFTSHAGLMRALDPGLARLIDELKERDLFDRTLIVCAGEFGRSPSIGKEEGRDHHSRCFSALMAGGGLARGKVLGGSDARGDRPAGPALKVTDLLATVLDRMGVDPRKTYMAGDRPLEAGSDGRVLTEVF